MEMVPQTRQDSICFTLPGVRFCISNPKRPIQAAPDAVCAGTGASAGLLKLAGWPPHLTGRPHVIAVPYLPLLLRLLFQTDSFLSPSPYFSIRYANGHFAKGAITQRIEVEILMQFVSLIDSRQPATRPGKVREYCEKCVKFGSMLRFAVSHVAPFQGKDLLMEKAPQWHYSR